MRAIMYKSKRLHCPCCRCKGRVQCSLEKIKDHLIHNGKVWRGPGAKDDSDDEWVQEFRRPCGAHDGHFDARLDMQGMVEDAFQQCDEPPIPVPPLEKQLEHIVIEALTIAEELANIGVDESDNGTNDEHMGDKEGSTSKEKNHIDQHVLEKTMEEVYHGARSSILATTILIMIFCTKHGVSNKFADQLFILFRKHLLPSDNQLPKKQPCCKSFNTKTRIKLQHNSCMPNMICFV